MRRLLLLLAVCLPLLSLSQKKNKSLVKISNSIRAEDLKKHLYVIASDEMGGRDTPSPGLEKAAEYIENHFRQIGLKPGNSDSYRLPYTIYRDSVVGSSLAVNGRSYEADKDFQAGNNNFSAEMPFSEAVFVGYGIVDGDIDDYKDLDVRGKAVIMLEGTPEGYKPSRQGFRNPGNTFGKINAAGNKGVAAVLIVSKRFPRTASRNNARWSLNNYPSSINPFSFYISPKIASAIMGESGMDIFDGVKNLPELYGKYSANIDLSYTRKSVTTQVTNVMGVLEGTDKKDEYVIITAHYDHVGTRNDTTIYNGADDDGSGTVSVLELAETFAKARAEGKGPRRSILFMTVSGEEHGLWGSSYYANNPVYPIEKTTVDLNIDMIGRIGEEYLKDKDSTNYIYIIGDDKLSSDLTPITENVNNTYTHLKLDRKYNDPNDRNRFYYRSDHYNFAQKGIPIIFYFNGVHKDYHQPTDTPDKINYSLMEKRAKLVFFTAMEMANRDEMLKRDIPLDSRRAF
jgi:hypothetical protein